MERSMERHGKAGNRAILQGPEHGGGVTSNWDPRLTVPVVARTLHAGI
jgi:hypothetical protein